MAFIELSLLVDFSFKLYHFPTASAFPEQGIAALPREGEVCLDTISYFGDAASSRVSKTVQAHPKALTGRVDRIRTDLI